MHTVSVITCISKNHDNYYYCCNSAVHSAQYILEIESETNIPCWLWPLSRRSKNRSSDWRLGDRFKWLTDRRLWMAITEWECMTNCAICRDIIQVTSSTSTKSVWVVIYWVSDKRLTVIYVARCILCAIVDYVEHHVTELQPINAARHS